MYYQITTRCNFHCKHCGFACTKKGEDMSLETFRNAIKWDGGENITIGGGEPTIHPLFWQILGESMACSDSLWMATNGSQTETALALAKLAKKGVIAVDLSLDKFHDPIDPKVVMAFKKTSNRWYNDGEDLRGVRNTSASLIKAGRCKEGSPDCICNDIFVKPNGDVRGCGCKNSPCFGNVNTKVIFPDHWEIGSCYKSQPKPLKVA